MEARKEENMKNRMTPEKFWDKFSQEFNKKFFDESLKSVKSWTDKTEWTSWMKDLLIHLGEQFGYYPDCEYWPKIDIGFFSNSGKYWSKWSFEVAIEHENAHWPAWKEELNKLMAINAGLKVLITYRFESYDDLIKKLNEFVEIYKSRKYHQESDSYLLIFAPLDEIWDDEDFLAFSFDGEKIIDITDNKKTIHT